MFYTLASFSGSFLVRYRGLKEQLSSCNVFYVGSFPLRLNRRCFFPENLCDRDTQTDKKCSTFYQKGQTIRHFDPEALKMAAKEKNMMG